MVDLQVTCQKLQDRGERILMVTLDVDRDKARDVLEEAGGSVKTAIVMGKLGVGREEAEGRLEEADGVISRLVEDHP
jgi:N-acetylmuramic acid 6-phosphate etherase